MKVANVGMRPSNTLGRNFVIGGLHDLEKVVGCRTKRMTGFKRDLWQ